MFANTASPLSVCMLVVLLVTLLVSTVAATAFYKRGKSLAGSGMPELGLAA